MIENRYKPEQQEALQNKASEQAQLRNKLDKAAEARIRGTDYSAIAAKGAAEHPDHYAKAQGRAGELVVWQDVREQQGQAVELNKEVGKNFPIYDVTGPESVTSVKVRGLDDGLQLSESRLNQYRADLQEAVGRGSGEVEKAPDIAGGDWSQVKFNNAARYLHEQAKTNDALSPELAQSPDGAANYLRQHGELRIPSDHAVQVQADLRQRLFSEDAITQEVQARRLGLDVNSPNYQVEAEKVISRVKGMPITSAELKDVIR
jgi:hypothetical protein